MKVMEIMAKVREGRLQRYGNLVRIDETYVGRRVMEMDVLGRRGRGRQKRRWMDCIRDDLREKQLSEDVYCRAAYLSRF